MPQKGAFITRVRNRTGFRSLTRMGYSVSVNSDVKSLEWVLRWLSLKRRLFFLEHIPGKLSFLD
jgi:hypothetical protein